jgi:hypothetical protein
MKGVPPGAPFNFAITYDRRRRVNDDAHP